MYFIDTIVCHVDRRAGFLSPQIQMIDADLSSNSCSTISHCARAFSGKTSFSQFGLPLLARFADPSFGSDLRKQFLKFINPLLKQSEDELNAYNDAEQSASTNDDSEMEDATSPWDTESEAETEDDPYSSNAFQFCLTDGSKVKMNEQLKVSMVSKSLRVFVLWPEKMIEKYNVNALDTLPEICKPQLCARRTQECVSLYKCLEAFLREEPLGPEDMWLVSLPLFV